MPVRAIHFQTEEGIIQMTMTCAEESRALEETLAGTFKPADTFFLIESQLARLRRLERGDRQSGGQRR